MRGLVEWSECVKGVKGVRMCGYRRAQAVSDLHNMQAPVLLTSISYSMGLVL